jgi:mannose-6-phosphate isomerase-like protein (cupin superfamily)
MSKSDHGILSSETRPWGRFDILYDGDCKIKRLVVTPGKRLSLQSHHHRREVWLVIHGKGKAQVGEEIRELQEGSLVTIEKEQKHRLIHDGPLDAPNLEIIEIQTGTYFGEDDIVRYEDDFHRV